MCNQQESRSVRCDGDGTWEENSRWMIWQCVERVEKTEGSKIVLSMLWMT